MLSLVIDIQSDVVEGTLVDFPQKGGKAPTAVSPRILYATSVHIPRKSHTTGDYMTKMMLRSLEDLSLHMAKAAPGVSPEKINSVHYILSSPWVVSQSKTVRIEYEKDTEITEATVKGIIETDRKKLVEKYEPDMLFVEQKVFDVELNGYAVANYHGKKAKSLQISFAFTLSSDKIIKKIQSAATKHLHVHKEFYHSAILLQYLSSRNFASEREEYIVLHIHGELTDVVVVKKGFSAYLGSFPSGVSTLVRKVATAMKGTYEMADSTLSMYVGNKIDESQRKKIESALFPILKGWQSDCTDAFKGIGENVIIPRSVHIYTDSPLATLFKHSLDEMQYEGVVHTQPLREVHSFAIQDVI